MTRAFLASFAGWLSRATRCHSWRSFPPSSAVRDPLPPGRPPPLLPFGTARWRAKAANADIQTPRLCGALDDLSHLANASLMISCSADILSESFRIVALLYVLGEATRQRANGVETQTVRDLWGKIWVSRFWLWPLGSRGRCKHIRISPLSNVFSFTHCGTTTTAQPLQHETRHTTLERTRALHTRSLHGVQARGHGLYVPRLDRDSQTESHAASIHVHRLNVYCLNVRA